MTEEKNQNIKDNVFYNPLFFHNDQDIISIYQKTERICGAVFLVTRFIDDSLIKNTLQNSALVSFKMCADFVMGTNVNHQKLKEISINLSVLYAHLDNAFWSGYLSQMNSSVIQKEIQITVSIISKIEEKYRDRSNPKNSFLALIEKNTVPILSHVTTPDAAKNAIKDNNIKDSIKDIKDSIKDKNIGQVKEKALRINNQERVDKIKFILRDFKQRTIKDIAALFPNIGEKTIQREINRLIEQGVVKRIGDRRWSTYVLA